MFLRSLILFASTAAVASAQFGAPPEAEKAAVEAAEQRAAAAQEEEAYSVQLSKDEQDVERKSNNRMSAEVMSQRIRDMSENDPRVVALVIREWMSKEL